VFQWKHMYQDVLCSHTAVLAAVAGAPCVGGWHRVSSRAATSSGRCRNCLPVASFTWVGTLEWVPGSPAACQQVGLPTLDANWRVKGGLPDGFPP
jgi:hypothetical protein